jgi:PAS domain S-box-containing protein
VNASENIEDLLAWYRRIVEKAQEGIWTIDVDARTSFVNPKMAAMLGYAPEEMLGRALLDFMDAEARASATEHLARRRGGIAEEHEFRFLRKDGSILWASLSTTPIADADGGYAGALAMVRDVTDHHESEASLRAAEERFRSLFENSPHVLWEDDLSGVKAYIDGLRASGVSDLRDHFARHPEDVVECFAKAKILDVNQAAVRLYEAADKTDLIRGLDRILTAESYVVLAEELIALAEGKTVFESEAIDQTFTGRKNHILFKAIVAPGCEATWSRVYISIVDITSRKLLEEQLLQSQKMEAIGRLAGGVAHDFNNLLTVIRGNSELVQMEDISDQLRGEALLEIVRATERAASLTKQLLTFSRRQVLQRQKLDLNEIVAGLTKMLERVLGEDVRLDLRLHERPLVTDADAGMLEQMLMNLAVNARDAMPAGGRLIIETFAAVLSEEERARFPAKRSGPHVGVRVADTGVGIPSQTMAHVFEPFFTTKGPGKGTGLGLATVLGIIEQHGGAVRVASEPGRGAEFTVVLPACDEVAAGELGRAPTVAPRGGTEAILLVEDEEPVRRLTQRLLEARGYRVQSAATGVEALRIWDEQQGDFDLVVTDMVMPGGISGRELAESLGARRPGLKVVFLSGYAGDVVSPGMELRQGFNFLQKPFGAAILLDCVRARLDGT